VLKVANVSKEFAKGDRKVVALSNVSFQLGEGQFASVIGKSGSGKSTLLSLLGALDKPTSGSIEVDGQDITAVRAGALTTYRRAKIGFVFQQYNLVPNLTAVQNVMLPMELAGRSRKERMARARELLDQVGLDGAKQDRRPGRLSGGEEQRVAIARALANRPTIILADEPTGNLDSQTGRMIFDLLHKLATSENTTILVVTHDMAIAGRTDVTFRLKDGKLAA
jgi:putative ABC transport system ATP-binding protein